MGTAVSRGTRGLLGGPSAARLLNVGGFTDGDRAVFLAEHSGARRILLWGFDFGSVDEPDPGARARKLAKLAWAGRLIGELARFRPLPDRTVGAGRFVGPLPCGQQRRIHEIDDILPVLVE